MRITPPFLTKQGVNKKLCPPASGGQAVYRYGSTLVSGETSFILPPLTEFVKGFSFLWPPLDFPQRTTQEWL